ncbi:MAG: hypothetical protein BWX71_02563 [Deltaproteobacteria bacterium ADurb.Bin072]|nr:MAG: hypothetical protein BWX71_02563 [Deltaproteobacteria bacterium ADurb.Bin072]
MHLSPAMFKGKNQGKGLRYRQVGIPRVQGDTTPVSGSSLLRAAAGQTAWATSAGYTLSFAPSSSLTVALSLVKSWDFTTYASAAMVRGWFL